MPALLDRHRRTVRALDEEPAAIVYAGDALLELVTVERTLHGADDIDLSRAPETGGVVERHVVHPRGAIWNPAGANISSICGHTERGDVRVKVAQSEPPDLVGAGCLLADGGRRDRPRHGHCDRRLRAAEQPWFTNCIHLRSPLYCSV